MRNLQWVKPESAVKLGLGNPNPNPLVRRLRLDS